MPFTDPGSFTDNSVTPPINASFLNQVRAGLDATVNRRGSVSVTEYGAKLDGTTDDTTAIQNALNTGADVIIAGNSTTAGIAKTTATLTMSTAVTGQRLITHRASIQPAFLGDVVFLNNALHQVRVNILGNLQPSSGDYSNVAMIRIGSSTANPQQASVAYSNVQNVKGSAIIWDQGSMIDFTHFHADTVSGDGIRCTLVGNDNNHGHFANTHIVSATGIGYAIYGDGTNLVSGGSRSHVFMNAKAFGCGQNYVIQSRDNVGTIFSEQSGTPSTTTANSRGNNIQILETATEFEAWVDAGAGNRIEGYSNGNAWETKNTVIRTGVFGGTSTTAGTPMTALISGQYSLGSGVSVGATTYTQVSSGVTGLGTGRAVFPTLYTSVGPGVDVSHFIDASGNLFFNIINRTGSAKTVTGTISYIIWRFA